VSDVKTLDPLYRIRHSTAHVMAEAVLRLFPDAKIAIGPPIEDGFYYDFLLPRSLKPEDLDQITDIMRDIMRANQPFVRRVVSREEAATLFRDQPFKMELIRELPEGEEISLYHQGGFTDLCRGPHVTNTSELDPDAFKLLSVAGAYWRGDERNPMLQRIYGTAWQSKEDLEGHLERLREIERRDHRKLGKELDLFSVHEEAGAGLIFWHPMGARIRSIIEDFWRKQHFANGYELVYTPHLGRAGLWETSGHLGFYSENMYSPLDIDGVEYYVKPMNCPFHIMIYKSTTRSYRDLPFRWAELGTVYRYERSGVLHGLLRVRGFTQDDAHIICRPDQIESEILEVLRFSLSMWKELPHQVDEGGGAFYGPKIDLKLRDALGREWQTTTIQFDFNEPERFGMTYMDADGKEKRPFMVHRALLGSLERFFGILIEHYGGAFPDWLAPVQAIVIPVSPSFAEYAETVRGELAARGIRVSADLGDDRMNAKIRTAQGQKIPYMLVVGGREAENRTVSVRTRSGEQHPGVTLDAFVGMVGSR
jgi:threonyl-tRNA synthetase